ncbi:hypothetical protein BGZ61DRAFT_528156 [Ilyonectria robusta]|uniref:uncharacterized protein n=1 Tax=Ilyonectria robusta TaxID=1079257 RepID=UPI001E8CADB6|nr:uncharacterized protein BGZ61DRAFT_528156 [Ilyonectria robusta]KAH8734885.1 hypothetical protein BGZ61DRAFT_528156 [Ilyonectria robusta]
MEAGESSGAHPPGPSTYLSFNRMKVTNIPSITELRKELDYGHARERRDIVFYNTVRAYMFTFVSRKGISGPDLLKWKYRPHQAGLLEMASQFLDQDAKGAFFWPDDPAAPNHGKLQYSKEPRRIRNIMVQLFFKINQQHKWKGNNRAVADPQLPERSSPACHTREQPNSTGPQQQTDFNHVLRGHSAEYAIDVDSFTLNGDDVAETKPDKSVWDDATTSTPEPPYTSQSFPPLSTELFGNHKPSTHEEAGEPRASSQVAPMAPMYDPFDGPNSPESDVPLAIERAYRLNKRPTPHARDEEAPQTKRPRSQNDVPRPVGTYHTTNHASSAIASSRVISPRRRNPPHKEGFVTGSAYNEAIESQLSPTATASVLSLNDSHGINMGAESATPRPSAPEELLRNTIENDAHTTESINQDPPPPPKVLDSGFVPKPAPKLQPEHEPKSENEPSKQQPTLPKVNVIFSVNVSPTLSKIWSPKGSFQTKSLADLVTELPLKSNFQGLHFALQAPGRRFESEVLLGDEDEFESMKFHFRRKIMDARRNHATTKTLHFEISISPLSDDQNEGGGEYEGDDNDLEIF